MKKIIFSYLILAITILFGVSAVSALDFYGYTYDENGNALNNTLINISVYEMAGGPPTLIYSNSTNSNESGWFNVSVNESSQYMYAPELIYTNSSGTVTHVGQILPEFPYDEVVNLSSIDFYLTPAATLNITAYNETGDAVDFTYGLYDTRFGVPFSYSFETALSSKIIYVPKNRNYSLELGTQTGTPAFQNINNISSYGENPQVDIEFNTSSTIINVDGRFNLSNGTGSFDEMNMVAYLYEPGEMVFENGKIPISPFYNDTSAGTYNFSFDSTAEESNVLFMAVGKIGNEYFAGFRNYTLTYGTDIPGFNFTLYRMLGTPANITLNEGTLNITVGKTEFTLVNSTSVLSHANAMAKIYFDYSDLDMSPEGAAGPQFKRIVHADDIVEGTFKIPLINHSIKEISILAQGDYASKRIPKSVSNLQQDSINLTLEVFNPQSLSGETGTSISIAIYRSNSTCNLPNSSCAALTSTNAEDFNPLTTVIGGGALNFEVGIGEVLIRYINVDLIASGPPTGMFDSNSDVTENTSGSFNKLMRFGSNGPTIYDYVLVALPYTEGNATTTGLNESADVNISIPYLYLENNEGEINWTQPIWNTSANGTTGSALAGNYSHFSEHSSAWETLLNQNNCTTNASIFNITNPCYIDKTNNKIWIRLPHFSGTEPEVTGQTATDSTAPIISSVSSSSITSSGATITWTTNEAANSTVYYGTNTNTASIEASSTSTTSHSISLSSLSASTTYYYNVSSCDSENNCNTSIQSSFTTSAADDGGTTSSGGGGTVTSGEDIGELSGEYIKQEMETGASYTFTTNDKEYAIKISKIDTQENKVKFYIRSSYIYIYVEEGKTKNIDLDEDGEYDITLKLLEIIDSDNIKISIKEYGEAETTETSTTGATTTKTTGTTQQTETQQETTLEKQGASTSTIIATVIAVLIIGAGAVFAWYYTQKHKK